MKKKFLINFRVYRLFAIYVDYKIFSNITCEIIFYDYKTDEKFIYKNLLFYDSKKFKYSLKYPKKLSIVKNFLFIFID